MLHRFPPFPASPDELASGLVRRLSANALARLRLVARAQGGPTEWFLENLSDELFYSSDRCLPRADEVVPWLVRHFDGQDDDAIWRELDQGTDDSRARAVLIRALHAAAEALPVAWWQTPSA